LSAGVRPADEEAPSTHQALQGKRADDQDDDGHTCPIARRSICPPPWSGRPPGPRHPALTEHDLYNPSARDNCEPLRSNLPPYAHDEGDCFASTRNDRLYCSRVILSGRSYESEEADDASLIRPTALFRKRRQWIRRGWKIRLGRRHSNWDTTQSSALALL
jgi:hypothetical protein